LNQLKQLRTLAFQQGGRIIHSSRDEYGDVLVLEDGKQRILNFDSLFEQSCMQLSQPYQLVHRYTRYMALAVAYVDPVAVTLLGLGGGSLLRTLHHALPNCTFHVVELRRAVVEIAKDYFLMPAGHRVHVAVSDAFEQMARMESSSSDIIFSDLYDAYRMAPGQTRKGFLLECARVLNHRGFLVINLHRRSSDHPAFFEMLGNVFPTVMLGTTAENTIVFASRSYPGQVEQNARRIEKMEAQLQQRLAPLLTKIQPL